MAERGAEVERADRDAKAVALRASGATYREIAATLGVSLHAAHDAVKRALAAVPVESVDALRAVEGERLDHIWAALAPAALGGDEKAAAVLVRISDRRAKLFGLDAPIQVEGGLTQIVIDPRLLPSSFNPAGLEQASP